MGHREGRSDASRNHDKWGLRPNLNEKSGAFFKNFGHQLKSEKFIERTLIPEKIYLLGMEWVPYPRCTSFTTGQKQSKQCNRI